MNMVVPGQMAFLVACPTSDNTKSCMMQSAFSTQRKVSSIPIVGSISLEGFLSLILLLVVIIATVFVTVVVVVTIVGVVIFVVIIGVVAVVGGVSFIIELSFMVIGFLYRIMFHYLLYYLLGHDNVVEEEDGGWICFLGNNSSGTKKYQGSNSSDGDNTEDGVKIADGVIESGGGIGGISSFLEFFEESEEIFPDVARK
ncbi:hypothetical protein Tco_0347976 [Tanacetum coccineum]